MLCMCSCLVRFPAARLWAQQDPAPLFEDVTGAAGLPILGPQALSQIRRVVRGRRGSTRQALSRLRAVRLAASRR